MSRLSIEHLCSIGLECRWTSTLSAVGEASEQLAPERNKETSSGFDDAGFVDVYDSALTKFDAITVYFDMNMTVQEVSAMVLDEVRKDLPGPELENRLCRLVRARVGKDFAAWKSTRGAFTASAVASPPLSNPLPWSSIDAYPDWVVKTVRKFLMGTGHAAQLLQKAWRVYSERSDVPTRVRFQLALAEVISMQRSKRLRGQLRTRRDLEHELLHQPVRSVSTKYDGTCFGKLDDGAFVGRNLYVSTGTYCHTSTAEANACDVKAFRLALTELLGVEFERAVVYGELMCNPGYYSYADQGLSAKWLCFGAVMALDPQRMGIDCAQLSAALEANGFAHSLGDNKVRLFMCEALSQLLSGVGCEVVAMPDIGLTHVQIVANGSTALEAGQIEGFVIVIPRSGAQVSVRKWKNSSEGGSVAKRHASELAVVEQEARSLAAAGLCSESIPIMLARMKFVAEADTKPVKKTRKG